MGIENLYLFIITGIILNLTPGPDTISSDIRKLPEINFIFGAIIE
jgi:hypothetical protein